MATPARYYRPPHKRDADRQHRQRTRNDRFYSSLAWRRLSAAVLREEAICRHCGERWPTDVDHIVPRLVAPERAYDRENLQALCSSCHAKKSAAERKGQTG